MGFKTPLYSCSDPVGASTSNVFMNNIAHSVKETGVAFYDPGNIGDCSQASHFSAYKNNGTGIVSGGANKSVLSNMVSVDNSAGLRMSLRGETDIESVTHLKDSYFYGQNADLASDCPDGINGSATGANCSCVAKTGYSCSDFLQGGQDSYATWDAKAVIENTTFQNFKSELTACGAGQRAIGGA